MNENEFKKLPNIRNGEKRLWNNTVHVQWRQEVKWEFTNPFSTRVNLNSKSHSENELMSVEGTHCTDDRRLRKIIWKKKIKFKVTFGSTVFTVQCPIIPLCSVSSLTALTRLHYGVNVLSYDLTWLWLTCWTQSIRTNYRSSITSQTQFKWPWLYTISVQRLFGFSLISPNPSIDRLT